MIKGLVFALESEFDVFKRHYKGSFHYEDPFYISDDGSFKVIISGVGKPLAAIATERLIVKSKPDVILNIGVAGGVNAKKGDLIVAGKVLFHDVDVTAFGYVRGQYPAKPPVFKCDKATIDAFLDAAERLNIPLEKAHVITGDQFVTDLNTIFPILDRVKGIKAAEMEAAAIALVADEHGIPFVGLKAISDEVGSDSQVDDFNLFLDKVMTPFAQLIDVVFA